MTEKAYVLIEVTTGKAASVTRALKNKPGIIASDMVTGPHDVICVVQGANPDAIARVVMNVIPKISGIKRTTTCLVFSL